MDETNQIAPKFRSIFYLILVGFLLMAGLLYKFYDQQKKENSALKIKIATLSKSRTITPWQRSVPQQIKTKATVPPAALPDQKAKQQLPETEEESLQTMATDQLVNVLDSRMINVKSQELLALDRNIEIANEIISREPGSYSAYKAKLISLLTKEEKFRVSADDAEINEILETMASFEVNTDVVTRREAALISNTNYEINTLTDQLNVITSAREELDNLLQTSDANSPEYAEIELERANLVSNEVATANRLSEISNNLDNNETQALSREEDIVQIPFLRLMAKGEYETVIDNASDYVEQFPDSTEGYYFLVKALIENGQREEALRVIQNSSLSPDKQQLLQSRLDQTENIDPKDYWETLQF